MEEENGVSSSSRGEEAKQNKRGGETDEENGSSTKKAKKENTQALETWQGDDDAVPVPREWFKSLLSRDVIQWRDVPEKLKVDRNLVEFVAWEGLIEKDDIQPEWREDERITWGLLCNEYVKMKGIHETFKMNPNLICCAIESESFHIDEIEPGWLENPVIVLKLLEENKIESEDIPKDKLKMDYELFNFLMEERLIQHENVPEEWLENPKIVVELICREQWRNDFQFSFQRLPLLARCNHDVVGFAFFHNLVESWDDIPKELQQDKDIIFRALGSDRLTLKAANYPWCNEDFVREKLHNKYYWFLLPPGYRKNSQFARSLRDECYFYRYFGDIMKYNPDLRGDSDFWLCGIDSYAGSEDDNWHHSKLCELVERFASDAVLSNGDVMSRACIEDAGTFCYIPQSLSSDPDFFADVLKKNPSIMIYLDNAEAIPLTNVILQHLPLIDPTGKDCHLWLQNAREIFMNHHFLEMWLRHGLTLPCLHSDESAFFENQSALLLIAQYCDVRHRIKCFRRASVSLRKDKDFMRQAMEFDFALFVCAEEPAKSDSELLMMASGSPEDCFDRLMQETEYDGHWNTMRSKMEVFVMAQLQAHISFCSILWDIKEPRSLFSMLEQGHETRTKFMKSIAEFLGVFMIEVQFCEITIRHQHDLLLQAKVNLERHG